MDRPGYRFKARLENNDVDNVGLSRSLMVWLSLISLQDPSLCDQCPLSLAYNIVDLSKVW
jgi:hypothetical protein